MSIRYISILILIHYIMVTTYGMIICELAVLFDRCGVSYLK